MPLPCDIGKAVEKGIEVTGKGAELALYGGSFTAIPQSLRTAYLKAAHRYVSSNQLSGIRISTRPDAIDRDILSELWHFGVRTIEIGAQSMEDKVLLLSKRGHTAEDVVRASHLINEMGFSLILQMMVGLPGETLESPMYTAERIAALRPEGVRIYPVAVLRGTELEEMWRSGKYEPLQLTEAVNICSSLIEFFEDRDISVLRVGLNPSEELNSEVLAGIYHPAFGDLCRSELVYRGVEGMLADAIREVQYPKFGTAIFRVADRHRSLFVGQHRSNIRRLIEEFSLEGVDVYNEHLNSATSYRLHKRDKQKVVTEKAKSKVEEFEDREQFRIVVEKAWAGQQVAVEFFGIY